MRAQDRDAEELAGPEEDGAADGVVLDAVERAGIGDFADDFAGQGAGGAVEGVVEAAERDGIVEHFCGSGVGERDSLESGVGLRGCGGTHSNEGEAEVIVFEV